MKLPIPLDPPPDRMALVDVAMIRANSQGFHAGLLLGFMVGFLAACVLGELLVYYSRWAVP
jgi:hypothetical protein